MAFHSIPRVVILSLDANRPLEMAESARRSLEIGARPVVVTRLPSLKAMKKAAEEAGCCLDEIEFVGIRDLRQDKARKNLVKRIIRAPKWLLRRVLRLAGMAERRSIKPVSKMGAALRVGSRRAEPYATRLATALAKRGVDPALEWSGATVTRTHQIRTVLSIVAQQVNHGRVVGVVCGDAGSLFPGWAVSKAYRGLPVHTTFPGEWLADLPAAMADAGQAGDS